MKSSGAAGVLGILVVIALVELEMRREEERRGEGWLWGMQEKGRVYLEMRDLEERGEEGVEKVVVVVLVAAAAAATAAAIVEN